jgi:hypothetical protein
MKRRGYPDRRGMGAQSDFIAEPFVPSETYIARQRAIAQQLVASGMAPERIDSMFLIRLDLLPPTDPEGI